MKCPTCKRRLGRKDRLCPKCDAEIIAGLDRFLAERPHQGDPTARAWAMTQRSEKGLAYRQRMKLGHTQS